MEHIEGVHENIRNFEHDSFSSHPLLQVILLFYIGQDIRPNLRLFRLFRFSIMAAHDRGQHRGRTNIDVIEHRYNRANLTGMYWLAL